MNEDLLAIFVAEGRELLDQAGQDLLALERAPDDGGALESLFRAAHTLKGSAGLVGFAAMDALFHAAEDRLADVRRGQRAFDRPLREALQSALWQAERWLEVVASEARLPPNAAQEAAPLTLRLTDVSSAPVPSSASSAAGWGEDLLAGVAVAGPFVAFRYLPSADCYFSGDDPLAAVRRTPGLAALRIAPREPFGALADYDPFACNLVLEGLSTADLPSVREAFRFVADQVTFAEVAGRGPAVSEEPAPVASAVRTLRVEGARVDALGAAVDELVVAKNALAHLTLQAAAAAEPALARALAAAQADLGGQVSRLHDSVTRLRLSPLAPLFRRFPGLVSQTAAGLGKEADLLLSGEDVEVDKAVADGLFEPLLHLVRNAIDHGVETPAARRAAGKSLPAPLRLSAAAAGDQVVIELTDDGRGLDLERIRALAVERGLAEADAAAAMSEAEVAELIFAPGFSTAQAVTGLSGRGVGLDAVRAAVGALGGRVQVHTRPGLGTRFTLTLPIRVRLARLMVVESAGEAYGVPLEAIVETTRLAPERLTPVRAGRALVWRDQPVPLLELSDLLRLPRGREDATELKLMIVQAGDDLAAVAVDRFGERLEAPLRPMAGMLAKAPGLAGTTLLADGRVLLVLDLPELIG